MIRRRGRWLHIYMYIRCFIGEYAADLLNAIQGTSGTRWRIWLAEKTRACWKRSFTVFSQWESPIDISTDRTHRLSRLLLLVHMRVVLWSCMEGVNTPPSSGPWAASCKGWLIHYGADPTTWCGQTSWKKRISEMSTRGGVIPGSHSRVMPSSTTYTTSWAYFHEPWNELLGNPADLLKTKDIYITSFWKAGNIPWIDLTNFLGCFIPTTMCTSFMCLSQNLEYLFSNCYRLAVMTYVRLNS